MSAAAVNGPSAARQPAVERRRQISRPAIRQGRDNQRERGQECRQAQGMKGRASLPNQSARQAAASSRPPQYPVSSW